MYFLFPSWIKCNLLQIYALNSYYIWLSVESKFRIQACIDGFIVCSWKRFARTMVEYFQFMAKIWKAWKLLLCLFSFHFQIKFLSSTFYFLWCLNEIDKNKYFFLYDTKNLLQQPTIISKKQVSLSQKNFKVCIFKFTENIYIYN